MIDEPLLLTQTYPASLADVWAALTETRSLRAWYFPQIQRVEPVVGAAFEFAEDGSAYQKQWRITQVVWGRRLAHSWRYTGYPGYSEVVFNLLPEGAVTQLTLTHTGLASFPADPHFARQRFATGWRQILGHNLRHFLAHPAERRIS